MLERKKKIISMLLAMALSASMISVFAADNANNDVADDIVSGDDIVVKVDETVLVKDVDYTLEYQNNVQPGTAKVLVHFIGNYSGEKEQTFNIVKKSSGGGGGGGGGGSYKPPQNTTNVTVTDKDGKPITVTKKEDGDKVIITLPSNKEIKDDEPISIEVTDKKGKPIEIEVELKDKKGNTATGKTDEDGKIILPKTTEASPSPTPTDKPDNYEHCAYISGYEDGRFIPDGKITRAETVSMLNGVLEKGNNDNHIEFSDLEPGAWYISAVKDMTSAGIINGYEDGTFRPNSKITRAEFVTMLMQNETVHTFKKMPFSDVKSDLWSADYIYSAYEAGYIDGYEDGTFRPDSFITRAEAVKIINSMLDREDMSNTENPFPDVKDTHWAYKQILEAAVSHNIDK